MLTKRSNGVANGPRLKKALAGISGDAMDRRTFLKRSGLTAGGAAMATAEMSSPKAALISAVNRTPSSSA